MQGIRSMLAMESEPPGWAVPRTVFMTGCMRSGTTFLAGKLSQHPQILHVGSELKEVWTRIGGAPCDTVCPARDESHFDVRYAQHMAVYFNQYAREARRWRRRAMRWRHQRRTGSGRLTYDWERLICLNKSTHLTNKIRYVKALFPDSKWIVLVRSILGNAASTKMFFNRLHRDKGWYWSMPQTEHACWSVGE
ncbi:MAG: sulfotransferase, partial [Saprospiraceae bacterium]|nr:sulfotransferase [Saprospiraceae bacterium]